MRAPSWTRRRASTVTRPSRSPRSSGRSSRPADSSTAQSEAGKVTDRVRCGQRTRSPFDVYPGATTTTTYKICLLAAATASGRRSSQKARRCSTLVGAKHGAAFAYTEALIGRHAPSTPTGDGAARGHAARGRGVRRRAAGGRRRPEVGHHRPREAAPRAGVCSASARRSASTRTCAPCSIFGALAGASSRRSPRSSTAWTSIIVRELTGGLILRAVARASTTRRAAVADGAAGQRAYDTLEYREYEVERAIRN